MKIPAPLALAAGPALGAIAVRMLAGTLRVKTEEATVAPLWAARVPVIYATWHGRLLLLPWLYGRRGAHALTSRSRDGEMVSRWIRRFGLVPVRGSSSRGGTDALRELTRAAPGRPRSRRRARRPAGSAGSAQARGDRAGAALRRADRADGGRSLARVAPALLGRVPDPAALRPLRGALRRADPRLAHRRSGRPRKRPGRKWRRRLRGLSWQVDEEARR